MGYKSDIYSKAFETATKAYDDIYPVIFQAEYRKLPKEREAAIQQIAKNILPLIESDYPEANYSGKMQAELKASKPEDWFKLYKTQNQSYSPRYQAEKATFDKFQDLAVDDKWMGMSKPEMDFKMSELGFDPNNKESRAKFYDVLGKHSLNYNRAKIVQDEMYSPGGVAAALLAPTATNEAIRQSLTGDFNDSRVYGALGADAAAAPLFVLTGGIKNPLAAGLAAGGIETGRQAANIAMGNEADPLAQVGAIGGAGIAAATVPAAAKLVSSRLQQVGGNAEAMPFARGFARGAQGFTDPYEVEREGLKKVLIDARNANKQMNESARKNFGKPQVEMAYREGDFRPADKIADAKKKLQTLGFESYTDEAFHSPDYPHAYSIEDIIGAPPIIEEGTTAYGYSYPKKLAIKAALDAYDQPSVYRGPSRSYSSIPEQATIDLNEAARKQMETVFPQKVQKEIGEYGGKKLYNTGYRIGQALSEMAAPIEMNARINPFNLPDAKNRVEDFKQTEWFRELKDKDPQKAKAIEKALRGWK